MPGNRAGDGPVARLMLLDGASPLRRGHLASALAALFRETAPLTAVALPMLAGLCLAVLRAPESLPPLLAPYLLLIFTLTLPHAAAVL